MVGPHVPVRAGVDNLALPEMTTTVLGHGRPLSAVSRDEKVALLRQYGGVVFRGFDVDLDGMRGLANELGKRFYNMALDPRIREMVTPDSVIGKP